MLNRWWMGVALGCAVMIPMVPATAQEVESQRATITLVQETSDATSGAGGIAVIRGGVLNLVEEASEPAPGQYWIGVASEPVSDALRSQLEIEDNVGLWVNGIMDNSPAKAAGLQTHDVLITASLQGEDATERPLTAVSSLSEVVQKAQSKPITLVLLRKGKRQTLEVMPAIRPQPKPVSLEVHLTETKPPQSDVLMPHAGNPQRVQVLLQELQQELGGGPQGVRLHMASPVVVTGPPQNAIRYTARLQGNGLPEGMTLTITKSGSHPTRIEVKKGEGQVWGANEHEIDTLPEEARALARSAIAGMSQPNLNIAVAPPPFWAGNGVTFTAPAVPGIPGTPGMMPHNVPVETMRQMAELHRQLAVEQSQKGADHPDVQKIKIQIEALHKSGLFPTPPTYPAGPVTATPQEEFRNRWLSSTSEAKTTSKAAAARPKAGDPNVHQPQLEQLQKRLEELAAIQAKQAEIQQQQLKELQRVIEKLATKE